MAIARLLSDEGTPVILDSSPVKGLVGLGVSLIGNGVCFAMSADLGTQAAQLTALSVAIGGVIYAIGRGFIKVYKEFCAAKLQVEARREKILAASLTRKFNETVNELKRTQNQLNEASSDRADLKEQVLAMAEVIKSLTQTSREIKAEIRDVSNKVAVKPKLLIVDDDKNMSKQLWRMLKGLGYELTCSETVTDARVQLNKEPAWVILDWKLPDGTGADLLAEIRGRSLKTKVVMVPGLMTDEVEYANSAWKADHLIPKAPIGTFPARLFEALRDQTAPRPHLSDVDLPRLPPPSPSDSGITQVPDNDE